MDAYLRLINDTTGSIDIDFSKAYEADRKQLNADRKAFDAERAAFAAATPQPRIEKPPAPVTAPVKRYVPPSQAWQDPSVVAVTDKGVGQDVQLRSIGDHADFDKHDHKPLPDSTCPRCRAMWVAS
jgi:hypothetical protein